MKVQGKRKGKRGFYELVGLEKVLLGIQQFFGKGHNREGGVVLSFVSVVPVLPLVNFVEFRMCVRCTLYTHEIEDFVVVLHILRGPFQLGPSLPVSALRN